MGQDIREMFRNEEESRRFKLPQGHENRFKNKLEKELPQPKGGSVFNIISIAAVLVVALGVGGFFFFYDNPPVENSSIQVTEVAVDKNPAETQAASSYRLSDDSPEFKKIEDYYLASLNIQLARLDMTPENKELIDAFMLKLETLNDEYLALNAEIKESGLNEGTVEAMISNLQLRLDLLKKLKNKLNEIEQSKNISYENHQA